MGFGSQYQSKPKHIALHQMLGIDIRRPIPEKTLRAIIMTPIGSPVQIGFQGVVVVDTKLKYRANFALNTGQEQSGGYV
jgi:hypothetical protein